VRAETGMHRRHEGSGQEESRRSCDFLNVPQKEFERNGS